MLKNATVWKKYIYFDFWVTHPSQRPRYHFCIANKITVRDQSSNITEFESFLWICIDFCKNIFKFCTFMGIQHKIMKVPLNTTEKIYRKFSLLYPRKINLLFFSLFKYSNAKGNMTADVGDFYCHFYCLHFQNLFNKSFLIPPTVTYWFRTKTWNKKKFNPTVCSVLLPRLSWAWARGTIVWTISSFNGI